jgi:tetratricopeptide (TPR) repeat protein
MFYSESGDFVQAAGWERKFALSKPSDPDAAARAAGLFMQAGDFAQTIVWSATALRLRDSAEIHHLMGAAYAASNRPDDALPELRKAVELEPSSGEFVFDLGRLQLERGDFTGASATFGDARRRFPESAQMQLAYGVAAYGQRQFDEAIDAFLRVVQIDPAVEQPYVFLGRILDNAGGRLPEVTRAFAAYHDKNLRSAQASVLYAQALVAQLDPQGLPGLAEKAFALTQAALRQNPDDAEAHYLAGCLLERKQDYPSALAELLKAVAANPGQAAAHFHLARIYERLGRKEDAARERELHQKLTSEAEQPDMRGGVVLSAPTVKSLKE